jgi:hypothetical protein
MIAHSEWKGSTIFEGIDENGNSVFFDANPAHTQGPIPMEAGADGAVRMHQRGRSFHP